MKRFTVLSVLGCMLAIPILCHAEIVTLYAGKNIDVGYVEVTNDETNLYITYVVNQNWCLTETHLHVAEDIEGIPQTKKGNPIPGQFAEQNEHNCEPEFNYTLPLLAFDADCGDELVIAAHAVVKKYKYIYSW